MQVFRSLTLAALMSTPLATLAADAVQTVKLNVNGMVCAFCAQGIEKRLSALPEAGPLYINLAQKVVAVEAKPGKTLDVAKLKAEVVDAGYEVTQAETVSQSVAQIRAQLKAAK
jgi:periplasmic mercuric ion binding protein